MPGKMEAGIVYEFAQFGQRVTVNHDFTAGVAECRVEAGGLQTASEDELMGEQRHDALFRDCLDCGTTAPPNVARMPQLFRDRFGSHGRREEVEQLEDEAGDIRATRQRIFEQAPDRIGNPTVVRVEPELALA